MPALPHPDQFEVDGAVYAAETVIGAIGPLLTPERRARIDAVIAARTIAIRPVLEGLYDQGNVSAVIRSAEALGCQCIDVIELQREFKQANRVTQGAGKWIDVARWESTAECVQALKRGGYRIAAMCMEDATPIAEAAFDVPTALVFGSERDGLTQELLDAAALRLVVPMPGFTRSFNISVAAALALYHAREDRARRTGSRGDLDAEAQRRLRAVFYLRSLENPGAVLRRVLA